MTTWEQLKALFLTLHRSRLTLALHIVSLPILIVGLATKRPLVISAALLLEVVGHAYDYMRSFDQKQRSVARTVLPLQLGLSIVVLVVLLKLFQWF